MVSRARVVHGRFEEHSKLFRDLLLGFVKIHVLHNASHDAVYGAGLVVELRQHGYTLSPGVLYPLLHNLEGSGFLTREERSIEGRIRKYYWITPLGEQALREAQNKVADLARLTGSTRV
jgi:DNA-binding PadR family transcriptional regulator